MCSLIKVLATLTSESRIFFLTFPKRWVGRVMGNEALSWDGLTENWPLLWRYGGIFNFIFFLCNMSSMSNLLSATTKLLSSKRSKKPQQQVISLSYMEPV